MTALVSETCEPRKYEARAMHRESQTLMLSTQHTLNTTRITTNSNYTTAHTHTTRHTYNNTTTMIRNKHSQRINTCVYIYIYTYIHIHNYNKLHTSQITHHIHDMNTQNKLQRNYKETTKKLQRNYNKTTKQLLIYIYICL